MSEKRELQMAFSSYEHNLSEIATYIQAMTPMALQHKLEYSSITLFVEGLVVMTVVRYEEFLKALLTTAVATRKEVVRDYLKKSPKEHERRLAENGSRKTLAALIRARVSFQRSGNSIEQTFQDVFGCSAWPDQETREQIMEFVTVRNVIVHSLAGEVGEQDEQPQLAKLKRLDVVRKSVYGDVTVYTVAAVKVLEESMKKTLPALGSQLEFLKSTLQ